MNIEKIVGLMALFFVVSVFEIHNIVYGPWSRNFQRVHKGKSSLPYHLCLTIETDKKTIDLQAVEEKQVMCVC